MSRSIYVNVPIKDVAAARKFYAALGFDINEQFSNEQNVFIIIDERITLMLVAEDFFQQTTGREVADPKTVREVSLAIEVADRAEVDKIMAAGVAAGGKEEGEIVEEAAIGMYSRGLSDLDGHRLNILCMTIQSND